MNPVRILRASILLACLALSAAMASAGPASTPDLSLWDVNKKPQKLSQYRGKIVILNFWATWCENCKTELPMLVDEQQRYRDRGVVVIAASVDDRTTVTRVKPFAKQEKLNLRVWIGATVDDLERLDLGQSVPATAFFDDQGNLVGRVMGVLSKEDLEHRIEWLLGNHQGPAPAPVVDNVTPK